MSTSSAPRGDTSIRINRRANANGSTAKGLIDYDSANPAWGGGSSKATSWAPNADTHGTTGRAGGSVPVATSEEQAGNHG
jgi:hypothetical protein